MQHEVQVVARRDPAVRVEEAALNFAQDTIAIRRRSTWPVGKRFRSPDR